MGGREGPGSSDPGKSIREGHIQYVWDCVNISMCRLIRAVYPE
jgi:hypothetical protein